MPQLDATKENTLTSAIETAVKDNPLPQNLNELTDTETTETETTETTETTTETAKPDEVKIQQALQLFNALQDPTQAPAIIEYLARAGGYEKPQTKAEVKEVKADITKVLEEELGDDLKFLAPRLGKALDKYLAEALSNSANNDDVRSRLETIERSNIERETSAAHVELAQEYFNADDMPDNVVNELSRAMDLFPPSDPKMTAREYYKHIFTYVAGKLSLSLKTSDVRAARNKNDAPARNLSSQNRGAVASADPAKKMNLTESIQDAMNKLDSAQPGGKRK